jgi:hypothetical protein
VVIPLPILWECYSMVVRRQGAGSAHAWLAEVRSKGVLLAPSAEDYAAALDRPLGYPDQAITLFDAILAVMGERLRVPVWTFDHHFDVMGVAVWR